MKFNSECNGNHEIFLFIISGKLQHVTEKVRGDKILLNNEFCQVLLLEIKRHQNDLESLRECLIRFKNKGIDKDSMLECLENVRSRSDSETEDILLELMVFT